ILTLALGGPGLVRDLITFHYPHSWRYPAGSAQRNNRRGQNRHIGVDAGLRDHRTRFVRLKVPVRRTVRLPNPAEVGLAVRSTSELGSSALSTWRLARP